MAPSLPLLMRRCWRAEGGDGLTGTPREFCWTGPCHKARRNPEMVARNAPKSGDKEKLTHRLKDQSADIAHQVKREAFSIGRQFAQKASRATRVAKDELEHAFDQQKVRVAQRVQRVGGAAHKAARVLRAGGTDNVAEYAQAAADGVEQAAQYIEETQLSEMMEDLGRLVRRHPSLFFAVSLLAGIAITRVAKVAREN